MKEASPATDEMLALTKPGRLVMRIMKSRKTGQIPD
jgi:hypothetical protein